MSTWPRSARAGRRSKRNWARDRHPQGRRPDPRVACQALRADALNGSVAQGSNNKMNLQQHATPRLTLEGIQVRALSVPLRRPIVSKVGVYTNWPFILIDVQTREGVVGRSYLEPYVQRSIASIAG